MTLLGATITVAVLTTLTALLVLGLMAAELAAEPWRDDGLDQRHAGKGRSGVDRSARRRLPRQETGRLANRSSEGGR